MVKEHEKKTQSLRETQEKKRQETLAAANSLTQAMVDHLNLGVAQAYLNEKKLDSEMRTLTTNTTQFAKQTQQWLSLIDNFNTALKELGHVQSWAKAIDADVKTITSCLELVYKEVQESPAGSAASGSSSSTNK